MLFGKNLPALGRKLALVVLLAALFALRVYYGLNNNFGDADEKHVYLIGLKWFTSGEFPFFGPDVVHTQTRIAGALQGLLIGAPFWLGAGPEMPVVVVNLLSFATLMWFARYLSRINTNISSGWTLTWLATLTWTLDIGTHVYNPSYLLASSVLFFAAARELSCRPAERTGMMNGRWAGFWLGVGLLWTVQLHLSWPLMIPFLAWALWKWSSGKKRDWWVPVTFASGVIVAGLTLLPTVLRYGLPIILRPGLSSTAVSGHNYLLFFHDLVRLISYTSYEVFLTVDKAGFPRADLLQKQPIIAVFGGFLLLCFAASFVLFIALHRRAFVDRSPRLIKALAWFWAAQAVGYATFLASAQPPVSRNLYVFLPIVLITMHTAFNEMWRLKWVRGVFKAGIAASLVFHGVVAMQRQDKDHFANFAEILRAALERGDAALFEHERYPFYPSFELKL